MANWIFVVTDHKTENGRRTAHEIYSRLMREQVWGLGERTPNRKGLEDGDRVVFYLGYPQMQFAGTAKLEGKPYLRSEQQKLKISQVLSEIFPSEYEVRLTDIHVWPTPKDTKQFVASLEFIENKEFWGTYFQSGVRQLSDRDFGLITGGVDLPLSQKLQREPDLESSSEFALEAHLEDFIAANWNSINFGRPLKLYKAGDTPGRQFPAGQWSIDFLCTDEKTNEFVVIELKRGKTSDAAVGQLARYMVWVRENLAGKYDVHGIIIAREIDDSLRMAAKIDKNISIKTYNVSFRLKDSKERGEMDSGLTDCQMRDQVSKSQT